MSGIIGKASILSTMGDDDDYEKAIKSGINMFKTIKPIEILILVDGDTGVEIEPNIFKFLIQNGFGQYGQLFALCNQGLGYERMTKAMVEVVICEMVDGKEYITLKTLPDRSLDLEKLKGWSFLQLMIEIDLI